MHPGGQVTYRITVTNTGSGISPDVDVLVTLPPALQFQSTIMPFGGNTAVEQPIFPVKGAVIAFYGGFEIPPQTSLGPGKLIIQFIAQCVTDPGKGVFPVQVQVTDTLNDVGDHHQRRAAQHLQLLGQFPAARVLTHVVTSRIAPGSSRRSSVE